MLNDDYRLRGIENTLWNIWSILTLTKIFWEVGSSYHHIKNGACKNKGSVNETECKKGRDVAYLRS